jgi:hypothetical protein
MKTIDFDAVMEQHPELKPIISEVTTSLVESVIFEENVMIAKQDYTYMLTPPYLQEMDHIMNKVKKSMGTKKPEFVEHYFGLTSDIWVSFYKFLQSQGILNNDDLDYYYEFLKDANIWSAQFFLDWMIVTQCPSKIYRNTDQRLHNMDGRCIDWVYPNDGNYFIHGISFKKEYWEKIANDTITDAEILQEQNMERRAAINRVRDPARLLKERKAILLDQHIQEKKGKEYMSPEAYAKIEHKVIKLYKIEDVKGLMRDGTPIYLLDYYDPSTQKHYTSYTTEDIAKRGALEAMASNHGVSAKRYKNVLAES